MVGIEGIEPSVEDSESSALPLGDIPRRLDHRENGEKGKFFDPETLSPPLLLYFYSFCSIKILQELLECLYLCIDFSSFLSQEI